MANFRIYNETLCPDLWDTAQHLNPEVRVNLLRMAYDFYEKTKLPAPIIDVYLMGSIANYNWTKDSDVDVHVIIDYNKLQMPKETAAKTVKTAGAQWNLEHNILVKGHKVEMNFQDASEPKPYVMGIYSLVKDQWIRKPSKLPLVIDKKILRFQYDAMKNYLVNALNSKDREQMKAAKKYLDAYRQYGLDTSGELSYENIIFKMLRARGIIKQLKDTITATYDQEMSVDEVDMIGTSHMGVVKGEPVSGDSRKKIHKDVGMISGINSENWRYFEDKNVVMWNTEPTEEHKALVTQWLAAKGIQNPRHKVMYSYKEVRDRDIKQTLPTLTPKDDPNLGDPRFDRSYWTKFDRETQDFRLDRLTMDELKALREKAMRMWVAYDEKGKPQWAALAEKDYRKYDAELERRMAAINKPISESPLMTKKGKTALAGGKPMRDLDVEAVKDNVVVFRESRPNQLVREGFTLVYFMDSDESAEGIKHGKIPYLMVPRGTFFSGGSPITDIWAKRFQRPGTEHILGVLEGATNEEIIYIEMITVRPGWKRNHIAKTMIETLKKQFPKAKVVTSSRTDSGEKLAKGMGIKDEPVTEGYGAGIPETDRLKIKNTDGSTRRWQIRSKDAPKTPKMDKEQVIAIEKFDAPEEDWMKASMVNEIAFAPGHEPGSGQHPLVKLMQKAAGEVEKMPIFNDPIETKRFFHTHLLELSKAIKGMALGIIKKNPKYVTEAMAFITAASARMYPVLEYLVAKKARDFPNSRGDLERLADEIQDHVMQIRGHSAQIYDNLKHVGDVNYSTRQLEHMAFILRNARTSIDALIDFDGKPLSEYKTTTIKPDAASKKKLEKALKKMTPDQVADVLATLKPDEEIDGAELLRRGILVPKPEEEPEKSFFETPQVYEIPKLWQGNEIWKVELMPSEFLECLRRAYPSYAPWDEKIALEYYVTMLKRWKSGWKDGEPTFFFKNLENHVKMHLEKEAEKAAE